LESKDPKKNLNKIDELVERGKAKGVLTYKEVHGEQVPSDILIQIQSTDKSLPIVERSLKQGMKKGLYEALDFGASWLENALM